MRSDIAISGRPDATDADRRAKREELIEVLELAAEFPVRHEDARCNHDPFHEQLADRVRWEPFAGEQLPFLACQDLAVFKALCNRTEDWADPEAMAAAGSLDPPAVIGVLVPFLGPNDQRIERVLALT